jgi:hypothetical protein
VVSGWIHGPFLDLYLEGVHAVGIEDRQACVHVFKRQLIQLGGLLGICGKGDDWHVGTVEKRVRGHSPVPNPFFWERIWQRGQRPVGDLPTVEIIVCCRFRLWEFPGKILAEDVCQMSMRMARAMGTRRPQRTIKMYRIPPAFHQQRSGKQRVLVG